MMDFHSQPLYTKMKPAIGFDNCGYYNYLFANINKSKTFACNTYFLKK